jgi:hypothetical protein
MLMTGAQSAASDWAKAVFCDGKDRRSARKSEKTTLPLSRKDNKRERLSGERIIAGTISAHPPRNTEARHPFPPSLFAKRKIHGQERDGAPIR